MSDKKYLDKEGLTYLWSELKKKLVLKSGDTITGALTVKGSINGNLTGNVQGIATSATQLTTSAGSTTQPIYFSDGKPTACTYSLNKTVPSDAEFTDTKNTAGATNTTTTSKIYLIGATSQDANPQTYSNNHCYILNGYLYSGELKVLTEHQSVTNNDVTLSWGNKSTIATIGSTDITLTMPTKPSQNTSKNVVGKTSGAIANDAAENGYVWLNHLENSTITSTHNIVGTGATTVVSDANGYITINSTHLTNSLTIKSGTTTVTTFNQSADKALQFLAGSNIALTPDTTNGTITISSSFLDTNRPIWVNGTAILDDLTYTPLNLKSDTKISLTTSTGTSSKDVTIGHLAGNAANRTLKFYKFATDSTSHITETSEVAATDLTKLIGTETYDAYGAATTAETNAKQYANSTFATKLSVDGYTLYLLNSAGTGLSSVTLPSSSSKNIISNSSGATADGAATNGKVWLNHLEGGTVTSAHNIIGTGATTVVSDSSGYITINSTDTNTSHSHSTGLGLIGSGSAGTGGGTYTYKVALASETLDTNASITRPSTVSTRIYPVIPDKNGKLAVIVPWSDSDTHYTNSLAIKVNGSTNAVYYTQDTDEVVNFTGSGATSVSTSDGTITISSTDTVYTHPVGSEASASLGLYKIATDGYSHVKELVSVTKEDITNLGIPGSDTNTHRPIQVNGTQVLGDNTTALNLKAGTNVTLSNSSGTVTITADDTRNTAGSSEASTEISKLYIVGAQSQIAAVTTYSRINAYIDASGYLYSYGKKVVTTDDSRLSDARKPTAHTHTKSEITDFPTSMPASDVYAWAKASAKPTYTYSEVGAPSTTGTNASGTWAISISGNAATATDAVSADTAAKALGLDLSSAVGSTTQPVYFKANGEPAACTYSLNKTVPSDAEFTDTHHTYTFTISTLVGSTSTQVQSFDQASNKALVFQQGNNITLTPNATSGIIYISAKDTTYSVATTSANGLMSSTDKSKLDGIASGATKVIESTVSGWGFTKNTGTVTSITMNGTSYTPSSGVVNLGTVITAHQSLDGKVDKTITVNGHALSSNVTVTASDVGLGSVGNFKAVSTVASQGLSDTEKSNARTNIGAGTSSFSGSYNDLTNKPTIPTVNNATLTIQKNSTSVGTFTANASSDKTINITVPTKVSELTNDSGYTTNTGTVTSIKVSINGTESSAITTSGTIDLGTGWATQTWVNSNFNKVTANPSTTASTTLSKITIGSTTYSLPNSGGGLPTTGGTMTGNIMMQASSSNTMEIVNSGYIDFKVDPSTLSATRDLLTIGGESDSLLRFRSDGDLRFGDKSYNLDIASGDQPSWIGTNGVETFSTYKCYPSLGFTTWGGASQRCYRDRDGVVTLYIAKTFSLSSLTATGGMYYGEVGAVTDYLGPNGLSMTFAAIYSVTYGARFTTSNGYVWLGAVGTGTEATPQYIPNIYVGRGTSRSIAGTVYITIVGEPT